MLVTSNSIEAIVNDTETQRSIEIQVINNLGQGFGEATIAFEVGEDGGTLPTVVALNVNGMAAVDWLKLAV